MSDRSKLDPPNDARLSENHRLLVPMRLQALAVKDPNDVPWQWADLTPLYNRLNADRPPLGFDLRPELFRKPEEPPGAGIHLHWTLPAAFTHVYQAKESPVAFPQVPNRWLVVRLWENPSTDMKQALQHKAWVVESDFLGKDGTNDWLTLNETSREFGLPNKLGRSCDLKTYRAKKNRWSLTAVAPANLAFASFYLSCRNVFGFHDADGDLRSGVVYSYIVVGWFAEPGVDPLSGCKSREDWTAQMDKLRWSVPAGTRELPARILCHASIHSVTWPPTPADIARDLPDFEVAIGSSVLEAIAALVNHKTQNDKDERSRLLDELQFAILQDRPPSADELFDGKVTERSDLTRLRARLHEKTFTALPGGIRWEIDKPSQEPGQAARKSSTLLELPEGLAARFREINRNQRDCDSQQRQLAGLQRKLYAQWYKRRLLQLGTGPRGFDRNALDKLIEDLKKQIHPLRETIAQLQTRIAAHATEIRSQLLADGEWKNYALVDRPMPRYWQGNDPALVMTGVPVPAIQDGATPLVCRVTGQTISALVVREVPGVGIFSVSAENLKDATDAVGAITTAAPGEVRDDFAALLAEAIFLNPHRALLLARIERFKRMSGTDIDYFRVNDRSVVDYFGEIASTDPEGVRVVKTLVAAQAPQQAKPAFDNFSTGSLPEAGFLSALSATGDRRRSGWTPVFMIWAADYHPSGSDAGHSVPYKGYAPLSDTIGRGLAKENGKFPWEIKYDKDKFLFADAVGWKSLVAQSMGGLTEALIMQDGLMQLPPLKGDTLAIDQEMFQLLDRHYAIAPLPDVLSLPKSGFFPIRDGQLDIRRVWLVDTFGRTRKVIDRIDHVAAKGMHISRSLTVADDPNRLRLAQRLVQPSRLLFRWLSAANDEQEFLGDRATQPVCGWIVPNRLDHSLMILDGKGRAVGAIQTIIQPGGWDNKGLRWAKLPIAAVGIASPQPRLPDHTDIPNRHLLGFVNGLLALGNDPDTSRTGAFQNLIRLITKTTQANPSTPEYQSLSVLVGQPLALVRASLSLDLLGPPAADHSWSASGPGAAQPAADDFTQRPFQVWLGDRRQGPDGLIGYFRSDQYDSLYLARDLEPGGDGDDETYFPRLPDRVLQVTCDPAARATFLTLLVDPRAGVHIRSDLLPAKLIDLPPDLVAAALSTLDVPFLVAPVLGERQKGLPNIPLPGDMPGEWTWTRIGEEPQQLETENLPARSLFGQMAFYEGWLSLRQKSTEG